MMENSDIQLCRLEETAHIYSSSLTGVLVLCSCTKQMLTIVCVVSVPVRVKSLIRILTARKLRRDHPLHRFFGLVPIFARSEYGQSSSLVQEHLLRRLALDGVSFHTRIRIGDGKLLRLVTSVGIGL